MPPALTVCIRGVQHCAGCCGGVAISHIAHMLRIAANMEIVTLMIVGSVFIFAPSILFAIACEYL